MTYLFSNTGRTNLPNQGNDTYHKVKEEPLKLLVKHRIPLAVTLHVYNEVLEVCKQYFGLVTIEPTFFPPIVNGLLYEDLFVDISNALPDNASTRASIQSAIANSTKFKEDEILYFSYEMITSEGILPYFKGNRRLILEAIIMKLKGKRWGFGGVEAIPSLQMIEGISTPKIALTNKYLLRLRD